MLRFELRTACLQNRCSSQLSYFGEINWSGQQDSNLRTLAPKASPFGHLWNTRKVDMAPGRGLEPRSSGPKPGVLPIRRPRNVGENGRTRTSGLLVRNETLYIR